jgi:hypothetical protein
MIRAPTRLDGCDSMTDLTAAAAMAQSHEHYEARPVTPPDWDQIDTVLLDLDGTLLDLFTRWYPSMAVNDNQVPVLARAA